MRIIFYTVARSFGGGERYLTHMVSGLRSKGVESYIVCASDSAPKQLKELSVEHIELRQDDVIVLNGIGALYRFSKSLPKHFASVFVSHSLMNDHQSFFLKRWIRPILVKFLISRVTTVVRVCHAAMPDSYFTNIETVYNGIPYNYEHYPAHRTGREFNIAMLGSVNKNKGQELAIQILPELPSYTTLWIIGDGPLRTKLEKVYMSPKMSSRIKWTGFIANPARYLERCHLLLVLSKDEALPYAALEAMASGIPVISTMVGGMPELVRNGYNGFLVNRKDKDSIIYRILQLCLNENKRYSMAINASHTIRDSFNLDTMTSEFIRVCASTLNRSKLK